MALKVGANGLLGTFDGDKYNTAVHQSSASSKYFVATLLFRSAVPSFRYFGIGREDLATALGVYSTASKFARGIRVYVKTLRQLSSFVDVNRIWI